jgi:tyrosyl-tRNA synthetase
VSASSFAPVDEQIARLTRGVVDLTTREDLEAKLALSLKEGRPLKIKVGFDPTAPDIHLGHTVLMRKMRDFQDEGHTVLYVIGDFTAMIGDPSGRSKTRPPLSREEILENARTYQQQAFRILDPERTVTRLNSEWLGELGSEGFIRLAGQYNVARMLERRDFRERYEKGVSISVHEFLYPLAQAYDSVALEADVELGGTDQLFNLNVGRDVMPSYGLAPQVVMTTPLLEGTDGVQKMSKSLDNYVGVEEPPGEIFGKVMSISDELMWRWYELLTRRDPEELAGLRREVESGAVHPKAAKRELGCLIAADFHGREAAEAAAEEFERITGRGAEVPDEVPEHRRPAEGGEILLAGLLVEAGLAASRGEAKRLIRGGGVEVDGAKAERFDQTLPATGEVLLRAGKRRYARVVFED